MKNHNISSPLLEVRSLGCKLGDRRLFNNLDLRVDPDEVVVIVGRSGGGKSVLFRHIMGLMSPQQGTVQVMGRLPDPSDPPPGLGVVFQRSALLDDLNVAENIGLAAAGGPPGDEAIVRLLHRVGLDRSCMAKVPSQLSGGMQRRVAVARALIDQPRILLMDEPTTGLDAISINAIAELLVELRAESPGSSMLIITHDYGFASQVADRILFLDSQQGRLEELFSADEIGQGRSQDPDAAHQDLRGRVEARFRQGENSRDEETHTPAPARPSFWAAIPGDLARGAEELLAVLGEVMLLFTKIRAPHPEASVLRRFGDLVLSALPMAGAAGVLAGLILIIQTRAGVAEMGNADALPAIFAAAFLREIGPLLTGVLLAGRNGSGMAAEVGSKWLGQQLDALRFMRVPPESWLLSPMLLSMVLGQLLLTCVMVVSGLLVGALFMEFQYQVTLGASLHETAVALGSSSLMEGLVKTLIFPFLITFVSWSMGNKPKESTEDLGRDTTAAVVWASFFVVATDVLVGLVIRFPS